MRPRVAVATVLGKAYFLIVNELKARHIPFISLMPSDVIRAEIRVVITTEREARFVNHPKILVLNSNADPETLGNEVTRILQGKETYESVTIGVDPGEVFGVAVIADQAMVDAKNCESVRETANKIKNTVRTFDLSKTAVAVKVGGGVPIYRELTETLDEELPIEVTLQVVSEAGTNRYTREDKHRRGFRHMASAVQIARRTGYTFERRHTVEPNS